MQYSAEITDVTTLEQAESMRQVRNGVRLYMTHNNTVITYREQQDWFEQEYSPRREAGTMLGYLATVDQQPIGYGLIRQDEGKWLVTGGITAPMRGAGYGRQLFKHLTDSVRDQGADEAWLDVLPGNERAIRLYYSLGYLVTENTANLIIMRCKL